MAHKTDITWRGHRVGSMQQNQPVLLGALPCAIRQIEVDGEYSVTDVRDTFDAIVMFRFAPEFVELYGITGVAME